MRCFTIISYLLIKHISWCKLLFFEIEEQRRTVKLLAVNKDYRHVHLVDHYMRNPSNRHLSFGYAIDTWLSETME